MYPCCCLKKCFVGGMITSFAKVPAIFSSLTPYSVGSDTRFRSMNIVDPVRSIQNSNVLQLYAIPDLAQFKAIFVRPDYLVVPGIYSHMQNKGGYFVADEVTRLVDWLYAGGRMVFMWSGVPASISAYPFLSLCSVPGNIAHLNYFMERIGATIRVFAIDVSAYYFNYNPPVAELPIVPGTNFSNIYLPVNSSATFMGSTQVQHSIPICAYANQDPNRECGPLPVYYWTRLIDMSEVTGGTWVAKTYTLGTHSSGTGGWFPFMAYEKIGDGYILVIGTTSSIPIGSNWLRNFCCGTW